MTSNLGSHLIQDKMGTLTEENRDELMGDLRVKLFEMLKQSIRPEFLNRIDEIIMFSPLSIDEMEQIVDLQIKEVQDRLNEYNIKVELTEAARKWLAKEGYDAAFGARPLRRAIQKYVESPLSVELLGGKYKDGAIVLVDVDEKNNRISFQKAEPLKQAKQQVDA